MAASLRQGHQRRPWPATRGSAGAGHAPAMLASLYQTVVVPLLISASCSCPGERLVHGQKAGVAVHVHKAGCRGPEPPLPSLVDKFGAARVTCSRERAALPLCTFSLHVARCPVSGSPTLQRAWLVLMSAHQGALMSANALRRLSSWLRGAPAPVLDRGRSSAWHAMRAASTAPRPELHKLLVANRGEIACRVLTTARYGQPAKHP